MSARFRRGVLRMMDTRSLVSTRSRPRSTSSTAGNLPSLKLKSVRSSQPLSRLAGCAPPAIQSKPSARRNCPSFASVHPARSTEISTCDTFEGFANRSARHSRARVRATRSSFAAPILPGTMYKIVIPTLEEFSGKKAASGLRRLQQPGISARGFGGEGFPVSTQDRHW